MSRSILLLIIIALAVYMIADTFTGQRRILHRFVVGSIPAWNMPTAGEVLWGR